MVSVTEIKKANELSKELKKHGFAHDFSDAYKQAEKIYGREKESPEVESAPEKVVVEEGSDDELMRLRQRVKKLERYKKFAEKRKNGYEERISEMVDKMNEMIKSINLIEMNQQSFQRQLNDVKKGGVPESKESEKEPQTKDQAQSVGGQEPTPDNSRKMNEPIDQTGIAPSEVSVEKIFYSGTN